MAKPARLLILERARALIEDGRHWCPGDLARDARGFSVSPTDSNAEQRCALGAILAAAYQFTGDLDRAQEVANGRHETRDRGNEPNPRQRCGRPRRHLNLFDLAIAAQ
jgi:hypothetical protein